MIPFKRARVADPELDRVQDNMEAFALPLARLALLDGVLLTKVDLASGITLVPHKLGRAPLGWQIVRKRGAAATVYDTQDTLAAAQQIQVLRLVSSAAVTVDLWVF